jgi:hypothetical protein
LCTVSYPYTWYLETSTTLCSGAQSPSCHSLLFVRLGRRGLAKGSSVSLASTRSHLDWFTAVSRLHTSKRPPFTIHHTNRHPLVQRTLGDEIRSKSTQYQPVPNFEPPYSPWPPSRIYPACHTLLPHLHTNLQRHNLSRFHNSIVRHSASQSRTKPPAILHRIPRPPI